MAWESSAVEAGDDILAEQYNDLRTDVLAVSNESVPIGTICLWAGSSGNIHEDWLVCDGSAVSRATYSDLYTIQGNTFGAGNGSTTFNVPDMRDRFVVGSGSSYSQNAKGGSASVTLTANEMPSHTHTQNQHRHQPSAATYFAHTSYTAETGAGANYAAVNSYSSYTGYTTATNQNTGGGGSHENRPPYIGIMYIIRAK